MAARMFTASSVSAVRVRRAKMAARPLSSLMPTRAPAAVATAAMSAAAHSSSFFPLAPQAGGADVAIISKVHPLRSHSAAAQGGINAALGDDDSVDTHAFDTVKGSDYLGDQDAIEILAAEAPGDIVDLERMGVTFTQREDGSPAQRALGG